MEEGGMVTVWDNLSAGRIERLAKWKGSESRFALEKEDLTNANLTIPRECETIYHLAANPEVRIGTESPSVHFEQNIVTTHNLLEAARKAANARTIVFASTSTVYGEPKKIPTPEDYGPMKPISTYGASKLASEALISAYASTYGLRAVIYRLANVIGPGSTHGVIYDFIQKLREDPSRLEILGDGTQTKSYLHVKDCVRALLAGLAEPDQRVSIFNVGSEDQVNVTKIAEIVCREMGLRDVKLSLRSVTKDGRGWVGDVKVMLLDVSALKRLGWKAEMNSEEAVVSAARQMVPSHH